MEVHYLTCDKEGIRIDKYIADRFSKWSRSLIQQWIKEGHILVNGKVTKSNYKINLGDEIVIKEQIEQVEIRPEEIPLHIIYEDDDVIIVNKPRGMVVHPAPGHVSGTLVNGLLAHTDQLSTLNGEMRPGIVHRIDKDTSGLLIVAKNDDAHRSIVEQLKQRHIKRIYVAIVSGMIPHDKGTIDAPIGRDPKDRQSMTVTDKNSKKAITHFQVIERFDNYTYVMCELETGRTHQIRVHMKYIGHPVIGDPKYGPRKKHRLPIDGQALHAKEIAFFHPRTNELLTFQAPLPDDFKQCIKLLKEKSS